MSVQFSCSVMLHPMDWSLPGLPVHHQLPEFTQTHGRWVGDTSNRLILCCPILLPPSIFPSIRVFSNEWVSSSHQVAKYWSFSFSISPSMNIQDWFPLGWTCWISLQSKRLSGVFSNTTVQKHQFSVLSFFYSPTLIHTWLLEKP